MHPRARKVQEALDRLGVKGQVVELPASTRTSAEAAAAVGTTPARIAKSLVFLAEDGQVVLVVASGTNRVDVAKVTREVGKPVRLADADTVKRLTGFTIGGVPPLGHDTQPLTIIDRDLLRFEAVWAAAGTPHAVFSVAPADLVRATGARVAEVRESA